MLGASWIVLDDFFIVLGGFRVARGVLAGDVEIPQNGFRGKFAEPVGISCWVVESSEALLGDSWRCSGRLGHFLTSVWVVLDVS